MTARKSKNDKAWEIIFQEDRIIEVVKEQGFLKISSERINQQREARLMTKFDHVVQLPRIFRENKLTIQPISRGSYIIGAFKSYFQLPKQSPTEVFYRELPPHIDTLDSSNLYSESSAILSAFLSGMIDEVIGEKTDFTIMGRMSTGTFDYSIDSINTKSTFNISVNNSQCEIDGGFESENKIALIEAKSEKVEDFLIRQLYYPYRLWTSKTSKEVIPIFLTMSNDIFTFYCFRFAIQNRYNSLELVSEHRYCISKSDIEISDLRRLLNPTTIVPEPNHPFPQANVFPRIIDLLGQMYNAERSLSKDYITSNYAFSVRQSNYYVSAAMYLGLVERESDARFSLSKHARWIMSQHPRKRNLELAKSILSHRIFNLSLSKWLATGQPLTKSEIIFLMQEGFEKIAHGADSVRERRASTVKGWVEWILKLSMSNSK